MHKIINRRDFLKLSAGIPTVSFSLNFCHPALATTSESDPYEVLYDFFASFSTTDHISWTNYFASPVRSYYHTFAQSPLNQSKHLGLLDIEEANLLYAEKVDNIYAPKYYEFAQYFNSPSTYSCYKTITDMKTKVGTYFGNGINFNLVLLIQDGGCWRIGGICGCPFELNYAPANLSLPRQSYGFVSYTGQPSTITVRDDKNSLSTVSFSTYLKNVTYNEIGNMNYHSEAIKANVMAIKMCGWWAHAAGYRSSEGCDIKFGDVAYRSTYQTKQSITDAINAVDGIRVLSSAGDLFYTAYFAGSSNLDGKGSGQLRQNGSDYLAKSKVYSYEEILHYYYDSSAYNNSSVGTIRID